MFGNATLDIPQSGSIGPSHTEGLSDELAMVFGRTAARSLSEQDGFVIVTLSDGTEQTIGNDTFSGELVLGRLTYRI